MGVRALDQEESLQRGTDNPLQYSCLENPMDRDSDTTEYTQMYYYILNCSSYVQQVLALTQNYFENLISGNLTSLLLGRYTVAKEKVY